MSLAMRTLGRKNNGVMFEPDANTVLWLPGQEDAYSATIRDWSGNGNNGAITGATWIQNGWGLWTLYFDGGDFVTITSTLTQLAATTVGTFNCWVNVPDATPAANMTFISFGDTDANTGIYMLVLPSGKLYCAMNLAGGLWTVVTNDAVFVDNTWAMATIVQNGVSPVLYYNGVAVAQTPAGTKDKWFADAAGLDNGFVGKLYNNTVDNQSRITGSIALAMIPSTNLSASQVLDLYNQSRHLFGV